MLKKGVGSYRLKNKQTQMSASDSAPQHAPSQSTKPRSHPDYEKLGKLLFAIGETGTKNRKKLYRVAFWKGVWSGLGSVVGTTIVVSILLFVFNKLGSVPLVGEFIDVVEQSIPSNIEE